MLPDDERGLHHFSVTQGTAEHHSVLKAPSGHPASLLLPLKATNYVAIASYFLPLIAAYLNILDGYDLRSFKAKVETTCSSRRSINDGEADFERAEECAHWRWCDRGCRGVD